MAIPLEVFTGLGSAALGGIMTIWNKSIEEKNRLFRQKMDIEEYNSREIEAARKVKGFSWMRKTLLLAIVFSVFIWPMIVPVFFPGVDVVVGWTEMSRGFLWYDPQLQTVWQSFERGIVVTPLLSQMASAFSGFLLGNQITK